MIITCMSWTPAFILYPTLLPLTLPWIQQNLQCNLPFTCDTLTLGVAITKEVFTIEACDFFPSFQVSQDFDTSCITASGYKLQFANKKHNKLTFYYEIQHPNSLHISSLGGWVLRWVIGDQSDSNNQICHGFDSWLLTLTTEP